MGNKQWRHKEQESGLIQYNILIFFYIDMFGFEWAFSIKQ